MRAWRGEKEDIHEGPIQLRYYDMLMRQDENYCLTVVASERQMSKEEADAAPPLEQCIRTRWGACRVEWNGSEPLL